MGLLKYGSDFWQIKYLSKFLMPTGEQIEPALNYSLRWPFLLPFPSFHPLFEEWKKEKKNEKRIKKRKAYIINKYVATLRFG